MDPGHLAVARTEHLIEHLLEPAGGYLLVGGAAWRSLEELFVLEPAGRFLISASPSQRAPANTILILFYDSKIFV